MSDFHFIEQHQQIITTKPKLLRKFSLNEIINSYSQLFSGQDKDYQKKMKQLRIWRQNNLLPSVNLPPLPLINLQSRNNSNTNQKSVPLFSLQNTPTNKFNIQGFKHLQLKQLKPLINQTWTRNKSTPRGSQDQQVSDLMTKMNLKPQFKEILDKMRLIDKPSKPKKTVRFNTESRLRI